jgi:hypothetical protein
MLDYNSGWAWYTTTLSRRQEHCNKDYFMILLITMYFIMCRSILGHVAGADQGLLCINISVTMNNFLLIHVGGLHAMCKVGFDMYTNAIHP